ncbi:MAG: NUDIX domain-containing protein [Patescibacteria group bacterium]|jgi:ADP-ribose pyrophosphatase YjhB (NUDIX family)
MQFIIAAGPVIIENNKVLVNKHGGTDFWKFPGGSMDDNDGLDLEKAAKREAKEEMGIDIEIVKPLSTLLSKKGESIVVLVHYLAKRIGEINPGKDIREWKWLDINNLPDDVGPNIKPIIKEYFKIK